MARYVITDGTRWIQYKNGKYVPTSCPTFADEFSQKQAQSICENQLNKALRKVFHPEKWFNMTKTGTTENGLVDKTISGLYEVANNMSKLANNAEERCRELWEFLLLGDDKKAQKYFIGDISKYTKEEWCEALDWILENIFEIE